MRLARCELQSISAYSQSKKIRLEKKNKETSADFEKRSWRERAHVNAEGRVFIPPDQFKNALSDAAKFLALKVEGSGNATYTKHFLAGLMVFDPLILPETKETMEGEWECGNARGQRGGAGAHVDKCFPLIPKWAGTVEFFIVDDQITEDVFKRHLEQAGTLIGIGKKRPRNGGYYGRFRVVKMEWTEDYQA